MNTPRTTRTAPGHLTPAELHAVTEIARGGEQQAVADRLGTTYFAIKSTLLRARRTTGARSTAHLVAIAIRTGQVPPDIAAGTEVKQ